MDQHVHGGGLTYGTVGQEGHGLAGLPTRSCCTRQAVGLPLLELLGVFGVFHQHRDAGWLRSCPGRQPPGLQSLGILLVQCLSQFQDATVTSGVLPQVLPLPQ